MLLLLMVLLLAAAGGFGLCWLSGGFESYGWLWQFPLGFAGGFLVAVIAAFGAIVVICNLIDPDKPREKDSSWFRFLVNNYIYAILAVLPIRVKRSGMEKFQVDGRFMLVCNHLDNIDPAFLMHAFPKSQLAFIAKKETRNMFLVGHALPKLLCQLIDRENDRAALKTILKCISILKEDKASIAVFPEGRIVKDGYLLHDFRPGVFKIAQKAEVPIVVCTVNGTQNIMANIKKFRRTRIDFHLLEVIPAAQLKGIPTTQIAERVHSLMATDLGQENVAS